MTLTLYNPNPDHTDPMTLPIVRWRTAHAWGAMERYEATTREGRLYDSVLKLRTDLALPQVSKQV